MDCIVHGVKESDTTEPLSLYTSFLTGCCTVTSHTHMVSTHDNNSSGWASLSPVYGWENSSPEKLQGLSKIKQLVNAELGLKPTPKSRFLITTLCWGTFASSHMVSSRDEVVYNQESVLGSQGLWKATMEPVLLERIWMGQPPQSWCSLTMDPSPDSSRSLRREKEYVYLSIHLYHEVNFGMISLNITGLKDFQLKITTSVENFGVGQSWNQTLALSLLNGVILGSKSLYLSSKIQFSQLYNGYHYHHNYFMRVFWGWNENINEFMEAPKLGQYPGQRTRPMHIRQYSPLYHHMFYSLYVYILKRMGIRPGLDVLRCGMPMWHAPCHAEKEQCIMDLKIASTKNTLNLEQVSFVILTNISAVAFSSTAICGWLSSLWLPKSHNITHTCLCLMSPVFCFECLKNVEN